MGFLNTYIFSKVLWICLPKRIDWLRNLYIYILLVIGGADYITWQSIPLLITGHGFSFALIFGTFYSIWGANASYHLIIASILLIIVTFLVYFLIGALIAEKLKKKK